MNSSFDKKMKSMIKNENLDIPINLKNEIKIILENLPEDNDGLKKEKKRRNKTNIILIASVIALLIITTAFTYPYVIKMTNNIIHFFSQSNEIQFKSKQREYEMYNSAINYSTEDKGIKLTINNLAIDDNNIIVTLTVRSSKPVTKLLEKYNMMVFALEPYFMININDSGRKAYHKESESYLIDEYTFSSIQKYIITDTLPDKFSLSMDVYVRLLEEEGNWKFSFNIDKSAVSEKSITINPNITKEVVINKNGKLNKFITTIEKLSITPFGGLAVINSGEANYMDFVIRDEQGTYFPTIESGANIQEFICLNKDVKILSFIPVVTDNKVNMITDFESKDKLPDIVELSKLGGYTIENISFDNNIFKIEFMPYGAVLPRMSVINNAFKVVDKNGEELKEISFGNPDYNMETGTVILTSKYEGQEENLKSKIKGFKHIYIPNFDLVEDQTISVNIK